MKHIKHYYYCYYYYYYLFNKFVVSVMAAYAAITLTTSVRRLCSTLNQTCIFLIKYWLWFPDDGFLVNRNMLE